MKAIILCGGLGSRLGLIDVPKPMYPIANKPILEHNILLLKKHGIEDICIPLHHGGDLIRNYFLDGSKWGVKIQYFFEEKLLGTSGAVKNVEQFIGREPFFVVYGDNYTNINLAKMLDFHILEKSKVTIAVFHPEKNLNCKIAGGVITTDDKHNILSFIEGKGIKPQNSFVNAGVYILEPDIVSQIPNDEPSDFGRDIFPKMLSQGCKIKTYVTDGFVLAIDTKEALKIAEEVIKREEI